MKRHIPVLCDKVVNYIFLDNENPNILDCTLGLGGHALEILKKYNSKINYFGIDKDLKMLTLAKQNLSKYSNIKYINDDYNNIENIINSENLKEKLSNIIFDLGVNSIHLDDLERGFSFKGNNFLDMRLNQNQKITACDIVNKYREKELADIIFKYGEERYSRRIASNIVEYRKTKKITTTKELSDLILKSIPYQKNKKKNRIHPATKTFQAIRIEVNDELKLLDKVLLFCAYSLKKNGRISVISFHSLEDRIVKNVFKYLSKDSHKKLEGFKKAEFKILTKKPLIADNNEINYNKRSRSAKLRVLEKL